MFHIAQICTCFVCFPFFNPRYFAACDVLSDVAVIRSQKPKQKGTGGGAGATQWKGINCQGECGANWSQFHTAVSCCSAAQRRNGVGGWGGGGGAGYEFQMWSCANDHPDNNNLPERPGAVYRRRGRLSLRPRSLRRVKT